MELCEALNATLGTLTSRAVHDIASEPQGKVDTGAAVISADPAAQPATRDTEAAGDADLRFLRSRVLRLRLALAARMAPAQLPDLAGEVCHVLMSRPC